MELIESFLNITAQQALQQAETLFHRSSPPERPFDSKYLARDLLINLLKDPILNSDGGNEDLMALRAYIQYCLGVNHLETEETSEGEALLGKALRGFSEVSEGKMGAFLNVLQDIYNNLGFLLINREELEKGMGCLGKSEALYESIKEIDELNCYNNRIWLKEHQKNKEKLTLKFSPYWKMGINKSRTEAYYTLTLFYLAQAYTKLGMKEKAALYCGNTMKRQYENREFQVKEWCVNAISLSEFYNNNKNFAQSYYLLQAGESLIPKGKRRKLQATFHMCFARLFNEFLKEMVKFLLNDNAKDLDVLILTVNRRHLIFETLSAVKFLDLEVPKDYEGAAKIFRLANTQYKKALSFFVLDGYVTENIEMSQEMSEMLKQMGFLETERARQFALLEKRRDLLEPIGKELNPKAFPAYTQRILVELAEIYIEMFENRFHELFIKGENKPKKGKIDAMNHYGQEAVKKYEMIEKILLEQQKEQKENMPKEHYQSLINARFNMAKTYNKIYTNDKHEKIDLLRKSLESYKFIVDFIREIFKKKGNLEWDFSEQLKVCTEMVELIPVKIEKIKNN